MGVGRAAAAAGRCWKASGTSCFERAHPMRHPEARAPVVRGRTWALSTEVGSDSSRLAVPPGILTSNLCAASTTAPPTLLISRRECHPVRVASNGDTPSQSSMQLPVKELSMLITRPPGAPATSSGAVDGTALQLPDHKSPAVQSLRVASCHRDRAYGAKRSFTSEEQCRRFSSPTARNLPKNVLKGT